MSYVTDWSKYAPYFKESEFKCKHTGKCFMTEKFMDLLYQIRIDYGEPIYITSGYRNWTHPVEVKKGKATGEHTTGNCCDIGIYGDDAIKLLKIALEHGITRVGVKQNGDVRSRFLHLGIGGPGLPNPWMWSY